MCFVTAVRLKSRMIFYSSLPSSSKSVLNIQVAVNFLQVFLLSPHSVAELLRETGNTCDIPALKMDFLQFVIWYTWKQESLIQYRIVQIWSPVHLFVGRLCCCTVGHWGVWGFRLLRNDEVFGQPGSNMSVEFVSWVYTWGGYLCEQWKRGVIL